MMDSSFSMQSCKSPRPLSGALCSHTEANANDLSKWQQSIGALQRVHINLAGDPVDEWPWPRSPGRSHLNYAEGATPGSHRGDVLLTQEQRPRGRSAVHGLLAPCAAPATASGGGSLGSSVEDVWAGDRLPKHKLWKGQMDVISRDTSPLMDH